MSSRYRSIAALLEGEVNMVAVLRELARRRAESQRITLPMLELPDGKGYYMTLRWFLSGATDPDRATRSDILAEVWSDSPQRWFITLPDGSEVGPFNTRERAYLEARLFVEDAGWRVLESPPWDEDDVRDFPFPR